MTKLSLFGRLAMTFQRGNTYSPGRRRGSLNKRTIFEAAVLGREAELTEALLQHHLNGNPAAVQCIGRLLAPSRRRWRGAPLQVPQVKGPKDIAPALTWIIGLIAAGEVTEHEGTVLVAAVDGMSRAFVATDFELRLQRLEERRMIDGPMADAAE